ncbi:MAG: hypothetical protein JNK85_26715 [Verrucomicrobiales bacterium]|nr:hypothetical protein [Verrucomicrobiales bacterium]
MTTRTYKPPKAPIPPWTGRTRSRSRRRPDAPATRLEVVPDALAGLRDRILQSLVAADGFDADDATRLYRLVASEAEALAWQTAAPLLVFPVLFEEKLVRTREYLSRQAALRGKSLGALPKPAMLG